MSDIGTTADQAKSEEFATKMVGVLNDAALAIMTSVGHRTGLFDTMATMQYATSPQIAAAAGLNERYVREWLGAMVTGGVILHDPKESGYHLPAEHAQSLTRAAGPGNLANAIQFLPLMGTVEDGIIDSFRNGGGVPYSEFGRFHEIMAELSGETVCGALLDVTLPMVAGLLDRLETGISVLDVGCGSGRALNLMAARFPSSRFTGYDFSEEAVANATAEVERRGIDNISFQVQDVTTFPNDAQFDFITAFDAIHDQANPAAVLANISAALADGGIFLMQDIAGSSHLQENMEHPFAPFLYTISTMHCMTVSLALDGEGLGTMWGKELACQMLSDAGFTSVDVEQIDGDVFNYYYIARK
jgi:SAM-dependent methyltransferase|tara:strand:- start:198 stop:1274 length:1077 start_codon:yes stop_codon:yes gene_type:complete